MTPVITISEMPGSSTTTSLKKSSIEFSSIKSKVKFKTKITSDLNIFKFQHNLDFLFQWLILFTINVHIKDLTVDMQASVHVSTMCSTPTQSLPTCQINYLVCTPGTSHAILEPLLNKLQCTKAASYPYQPS